jgi:modulator of FtsH protease HflK
MAWNEPGGPPGGGNDPWGGGGAGGGGGQPPDLDEVVRKMQEKFGALFGGIGGKRGGGGKGGGPGRMASFGIGTILLVVVGLWGLSGLYIVNEGSEGVVLRFGEYQTTVGSGLHWHIPFPIESVEIVNVQEIRTSEIGYRSAQPGQAARVVPREALMLTQDENIVDIKLAVQYRIKNSRDYLFNVLNPDITLTQAAESALREVAGKSTLDFVLTEGRAEVVARAGTLIQEILDNYESGLHVSSVNLQDAQPPEEVQHAFDDAVKAREDEERLRNEAQTYANDILPRARGQAARVIEEASAYQAQVITQAEGDVARFVQILEEYRKAPDILRERLYIETVEAIMANVSKVMIDIEGGNNLLFLPLDRMMSGVTDGDQRTDAARRDTVRTPTPLIVDDVVDRTRSALRDRGGLR